MEQMSHRINGVNQNKAIKQILDKEIKLVKDYIHKELNEIQERWEPKLPKVVFFFQMDK